MGTTKNSLVSIIFLTSWQFIDTWLRCGIIHCLIRWVSKILAPSNIFFLNILMNNNVNSCLPESITLISDSFTCFFIPTIIAHKFHRHGKFCSTILGVRILFLAVVLATHRFSSIYIITAFARGIKLIYKSWPARYDFHPYKHFC